MNPQLESLLGRVASRQQRMRLWWRLAVCWSAAALLTVGFIALQRQIGWTPSLAPRAIALAAIVSAVFLVIRNRRMRTKWSELARQLEARYSDLDGRLITAVEQHPKDGGEFNYFQQRLLSELLRHSREKDWAQAVPGGRVKLAQGAHGLAFVLFAVTLLGLRAPAIVQKLLTRGSSSGITVTPGDTSLERGNALVVLARFSGPLPAKVDLVVSQRAEEARQIPLAKSLADPMFGGSLAEVTNNLVYHVEYAGQRTRDFKVTVFEYPRLERSDVHLVFPEYTRQAPQQIQNTRRLSAVEDSRVDLALLLNKPVASARLLPKGKGQSPIPLLVETNRATAELRQFRLERSDTYELQLVDAEGRTNKVPSQFVFEVLTNRTPELRLAFPRGDLRPTPLEEIGFEGTVWDDFGVESYGVGYSLVGQETKFVELGKAVAAKEKRPFQFLLRLENLGVQPDQLLSWFVWADDIGPDAKVRRTSGDLFFAEVRPFEEIFREGQGMSGQSQGESGQEEDQTGRLADLQKQIISATWKLQREHNALRTPGPKLEDVVVVRDSQAQALDKAEAGLSGEQDPRTSAFWAAAAREMKEALARLNKATNAPASLGEALPPEQAAYQALLRLEQHEYQVARARNQNQGGSSRGRQMQRQLEQMDLTQAEDRYESQRQAQSPQGGQRREQLQVMSRLQDLARRQQDLNDRLKELQTALQEARTAQESEEIARRLKRLQEEEQQMLADVDELRQRMDRPENQSSMADERRQLDQTREDVQRAAEAAAQASASQALAAGTRAQRRLQDLRDQMRKENSGQFADDLKEMRSQARELARQQEDLEKKMQAGADAGRKSLSDSPDREAVRDQLGRQKDRLTNLVEHATQISQQSEDAEPLLSKQLYDSVRQFTQDSAKAVKETQDEMLNRGLLTRNLYDQFKDASQSDGAKLLELTSDLWRMDLLPQARDMEQRARAGINTLQRGVERAADSVLGDDTEALRMAQKELNRLTEQLENEIARASTEESLTNRPQTQAAGQDAKPAEPSADSRPQAARESSAEPSGQTAQAGSPEQQASAQTGENRASSGSQRQASPRGASTPSSGAQTGARDLTTRLGGNWDRLWNENGGAWTGPITGGDFGPWSDRLRDVEEVIEIPDLRNEVAAARERARVIRQEFRRDRKKPDWAVVQLQIMKPLVQVRDRIADELAHRASEEALVPLDRDPVPNRYTDLVRRYYEELGKSK